MSRSIFKQDFNSITVLRKYLGVWVRVKVLYRTVEDPDEFRNIIRDYCKIRYGLESFQLRINYPSETFEFSTGGVKHV